MATESKIKEDSVAVPVAQGDLDAVSNGTFYNPHEVLGGHLGPDEHEDVVTIRVLRPLAKSVTIITENARTQAVHEHNGVFMALIPAIKTDDGFDVPDYRISTEYEDGSTVVSDDPYRYLPTIGDLDMYLFGEGRHERLWEALGARVLRYDDPLGSNDGVKGEQLVGTAFTVWAIVEGWDCDGVDEGTDDDQGLVTILVYFLKGIVNVDVRRCRTFKVSGSAILDV